MNFRIGIRLTTVSVFMVLTCMVAVVAISLQYYFGQRLARTVAQQSYQQASDAVVTELTRLESQSGHAIDLISEYPALVNVQDTSDTRQLFSRVLRQNPIFYGVYIGRPNGDFYELINLEASPEARIALNAYPSDRWVEINVFESERGRVRQFQYYDSEFNVRYERSEPTEYDPRQRAWFTQALGQNGVYRTDPYLFAQLQAPGLTLSKPLPDQQSVLGIDLLLNSLSEFLNTQGFDEQSGQAFIFQEDGNVIASSQDSGSAQSLPIPSFTMSVEERNWVEQQDTLQVSNELNWPPMDFALGGQPRGYSIDVMNLISAMTGLEFNYVNGLTWSELVNRFRTGELDILHSVFLTENNRTWGASTEPYVSLPFAIATTGRALTLDDLNGRPLAIPAGWSIIPEIQRQYPDINIIETESTLDALRQVQDGTVDAALDNDVILRTLINSYFLEDLTTHADIGLQGSDQLEQLVMMVDPGASQLLVLLNRAIEQINSELHGQLEKQWLIPDTVSAQLAVSSSVPTPELLRLAGSPSSDLTQVDYNGQPHYAYVRPIQTTTDNQPRYFGVLVKESLVTRPFMLQVRISIIVSAAILALVLPLSLAFAYPIVRPVRELASENDKIREHRETQVKRVRSHILELDQLSDSIVKMVKTIKRQEQAQRDLLDAFIQLIAEAIDQKSPYTGGHCARVPELAMLLVKAADDSDAPAYRNFSVDGRDAWREIRIASWLHDCGKVTTPEFVVDKATKLETIHNRIHEVRTRFEVLHRDAEIRYLKQCLHSPDQAAQWQADFTADIKKLEQDFEFVAECNIGGEFMDEDKQMRLKQIAKQTWLRHFDDRAGISALEAKRYPDKKSELPVEEPLLKDGPEHLIRREHDTHYMNDLGIKMTVPEYLYNRGELHNLLISRGTLTDEERFKINEHIIGTIRMLEALPFPAELSNVPRYASTHHEKMDGTGYPRRLNGEQLSIPERMLAVADVFEALTASDRPYKTGKTLSQTLTILSYMVKDNHLDRDAFELLLTSGLYRRYAETYLSEEQIDDVNIDDYLA